MTSGALFVKGMTSTGAASFPLLGRNSVSDDAPYLLDVTRLIWRRWRGLHPTGIDRVALAYLRHFGGRAQAVIQHPRFRGILGFEASQELFSLLDRPGGRFKPALIFGAIRNVSHFNGRGDGRIYLNVGHTGLDSEGFADWARAADVRPVYLVHDLIPITHPQFCRAGEDERHGKRMRTILGTAVGIVGNSRATLDELAAFARSEGLEMPAAVPAWLGCDALPPPPFMPTPAPARPTFVTVGTIEARKNHLLLLSIWSRLIDRFGDESPRLLVIGQRGWEVEPVFELLDNSEKLRGHVIELDDCADDDLARHLASARALLFPSLAEGYGLPMIEALVLEVPIIASDLPVFREIAGGLPDYLTPTDEAGWEAAIVDYAGNESWARRAQMERIGAFQPPNWSAHFNKVEAWLGSLA